LTELWAGPISNLFIVSIWKVVLSIAMFLKAINYQKREINKKKTNSQRLKNWEGNSKLIPIFMLFLML
jgi:hypothetical protein